MAVSPAVAQKFPSRPIQLIIPNVAGSIMDINARVVIDELGKNLGTQCHRGQTRWGDHSRLRRRCQEQEGWIYHGVSQRIGARLCANRSPETFPFDADKDIEPLDFTCLSR